MCKAYILVNDFQNIRQTNGSEQAEERARAVLVIITNANINKTVNLVGANGAKFCRRCALEIWEAL